MVRKQDPPGSSTMPQAEQRDGDDEDLIADGPVTDPTSLGLLLQMAGLPALATVCILVLTDRVSEFIRATKDVGPWCYFGVLFLSCYLLGFGQQAADWIQFGRLSTEDATRAKHMASKAPLVAAAQRAGRVLDRFLENLMLLAFIGFLLWGTYWAWTKGVQPWLDSRDRKAWIDDCAKHSEIPDCRRRHRQLNPQ